MVKLVAPVLALLVAAHPLLADSVILNSGEEHQGKIVRESDTEVVMEIQVSRSITDQRTFQRSDIKEISKTTPDEEEYKKLRVVKIGNDSYSEAEYSRVIDLLDGFLRRFPESSHLEEIKANRDALVAERTRVTEKEEVKWNNQWLTKDEAKELEYQIIGGRLYQRMREMSLRRDFLGALNTFDYLEKNYAGAQSFPDAVVLALQIIPPVSALVDRAVTNHKIQEDKFKEGIVLVAEPEKTQLKEARENEVKTARDIFKNATALKWKPFFAQIGESIKAIKDLVAAEQPRLAALPLADMRKSIALSEKAQSQLKSGDVTSAQATLNEAKGLWAANETLQRLEVKITSALDQQKAIAEAAAAQEKAAAEEAKKKLAAEKKQKPQQKEATKK